MSVDHQAQGKKTLQIPFEFIDFLAAFLEANKLL